MTNNSLYLPNGKIYFPKAINLDTKSYDGKFYFKLTFGPWYITMCSGMSLKGPWNSCSPFVLMLQQGGSGWGFHLTADKWPNV